MEITSLSIVISIHRAQDLQIFKDSEAAQHIRKSVEVRGLVVAVYTSKKEIPSSISAANVVLAGGLGSLSARAPESKGSRAR